MAASDRRSPVTLEAVTPANRAAVLALELLPLQQDFVAGNAESLDEADEDDEAIPRAVIVEGRVVGFLMYSVADDEATIYRLMIDRREQGKRYGRGAVEAVLREIMRRRHVRSVSICYEPDNDAARRLYASLDFVETGLDEDGEMIARLDMSG
ncbi:MAG TPA: GNAT family N-acetyltransferase [Nitrobacter sp.]|jgi:diamine N-acetyltransferase|nr:GNAT family N-acetyltransferase [Nitrobacter sp.]